MSPESRSELVRTALKAMGVLAGLLVALSLGFVLYLRTLASADEPVFVIEQEIEIAASREAVWETLTDVSSYPDWNPYVLALEGTLAPGEVIALTITQENWNEPLTVHPTLVSIEPGRRLGWHGSPLVTGFLETDHYFTLEPLGPERTRLRHVEEFRGWYASRMNSEEHHAHTRRAFRAMNDALAARVESAGTD